MSDKTSIIECPKCKISMECKELGSFEQLLGGPPSRLFSFFRCKKCDGPVLIVQRNEGNIADGDIWGAPFALFPGSNLKICETAPVEIQRAFREASSTFEAGAYTASAIMCRKLIEGLAQLHGSKKENLRDAIKSLAEASIIDSRLSEWADQLRNAGNDAAHDINSNFSREDASDMIEFSAAIVDYVYSFRERFIAFKSRRMTRRPQ